jgi:hypothetical protein
VNTLSVNILLQKLAITGRQAQPGPSRDDIPCARGRSETADDLLLHGDLDGEQW